MTKTFGATWWGRSWLEALEQRALVDPNRLPRGRTYARQGRVTEFELSPGLITALVDGTSLYRTQLSVRVLSEAEWESVITTIMGKAANVAALLAGSVPEAIGDLLLPDRGDLGPGCSCPDTAEPCKHAAAVCYAATDIFDADPFALLALRGRGRDEVLDEVRRRRAVALGAEAVDGSDLVRGPDPGVSAAAAFKRAVAASPGSRPAPRQPMPRLAYRLATPAPADGGIDMAELAALVGDAADRAWRMLAQGTSSGLGATTGEDVVRRVALATPSESDRIAEYTGIAPDELRGAAIAWRLGGRAALRVWRDRWDASASEMEAGHAVLGPTARVRANRVSAGPVQLRRDPDGQWWRFDADDTMGWLPTAGPSADPSELVDHEPDPAA